MLNGQSKPPLLVADVSNEPSVKPTPFHGASSGWNATNRWTTSGDYTVSDVYSAPSREYEGMHSFAAVRDLTPMPKYHVCGRNAVQFLAKLVVSDVDAWQPGHCFETVLCDENGYVIDIVRIILAASDDAYVIARISLHNWLRRVTTEFDLTLTDITDNRAVLGLYGPYAPEILQQLDPENGRNLTGGRWVRLQNRDIQLHCLTATELGDGSAELWVNMEDAFVLWERVMRTGRPYGIRPVGEQVYDQCRIEAGKPRVGIDFISPLAAVFGNRPRTPFELGLGDKVSFAGAYFNGKNALLKKAAMLRSQLVGLKVAGLKPVTGARVVAQGNVVGTVTSSTWSPHFLSVIGLATIDARFAQPGLELSLEQAAAVELKPYTRQRKAVVASLPFT